MPIEAGKYDRSITLFCPTCGGTQFARDDSDASASALFTCASCGLEIPKDELIQANSENINEHVKEIKNEVTKDIQKQLNDSLRKAFGGSKHFRIK
ncbi:hypothetical protein R5576_05360 [Xanthomonas euvesicatoria]|uniref:TFIIB-type zinc ribbon-containing protein n=1 Tax=Xanthomonas euvesicatoria TaxID=456327 RepID=A0AAX4FIB3_XANEU|nr:MULTISPECIES: hypothetical protein [Xanthomonas]WIX24452.1 hypothetical protein PUV44_17470 [Xanthomonas arboricola pv. corylina]MDM7714666.1 hypothetical protein [Xanthomonas campestris pv. campestris]MEB2027279.1 hypothetical protein [Xanthomonas campestris pv. campestris]WDJ79131.1 hypothetical protein JH282_16490 [Xanthomonas campestris pv. campestris]WOP47245.1 hypothetical protein R2B60_16025 [Xanthomonas euvesicatoria]